MSILLLTNQRDLTTDFLIEELTGRSVAFCRLNTDIVTESQVTIDPISSSIDFEHPSCSFSTADISAAYYRRPAPLQPTITSTEYRQYISQEWHAFLRALYISIGARWFSHPNSIFLAEDKPRQLALAKSIGFNVPETIVTNSVDATKSLGTQFTLVGKPLKQTLLDTRPVESVIYTTRVEPPTDADRASLSACPVIFQRYIPKVLDIRVTVVGRQVFSVAIHSQETDETKVDWRRGSNPSLKHEVVCLPAEIRNKCIRIVRSQDLRFGAIDLIQTAKGDYWFLECNPNGQWAWIQSRTGLPIAQAIVRELLNIASA